MLLPSFRSHKIIFVFLFLLLQLRGGLCFSVSSTLDKLPAAKHSTLPLLSVSTTDETPDLDSPRGGSVSEGSPKLLREMCAEAIGTFLIVQLGTASVMSAIFDNALTGLFQIASVWIIAVTIAIATTGPISGAHLNPAVSISFAVLRPESFSAFKLVPYIAAQLVGAVAGSLVNLVLYSRKITMYEAANKIVRGSIDSIASAKAFGEYYATPVTTGLAFFAEFFGTAILSFVIYSLTNPRNDTQKNNVYIPPLVGLTVGALIAGIAPLTQAGFNPARDFGPRIVAFFAGWKRVAFRGWWVYVLAPIIGALAGGFVADKVLYAGDE